MVWGMGFMAAGSVILGIAPQLAVNYLLNPILGALQMSAVQVTWFGLSVDAGSFSTMGGLVLAVVSLVIGGVIYAIAYVARPATAGGAALAGGAPADGSLSVGWTGGGGGIFTGGEPLSEQGRLTAGDFSSIFLGNWHEFFRWSNVDAVYLGVWRGLQAASRGLGVVVSWLERYALASVVILSAVVLAGARWLLPAGTGVAAAPLFSIPALLVASCAVAAIALILAGFAHRSSITLPVLMALAAAATIAGLVLASPKLRLGLLEVGALLTVALVWQSAREFSAKLTYLAVVLISGLSLVSSDILLEHGHAEWAHALLLTSVFVKLAAVPLCFWLLSLADELPSLVLGIIIAVVDMAAFGEFLLCAQSIPGLLSHKALLLGVAATTSFLAALLMLTQRSLKRLLVLSTVEDAGFLLLGVFSFNLLGLDGAIVAAATHAIAKALLFICLCGPEADGELRGEPIALAARYPVAAFGFLFGMLAMLGIPPTMGFIGRWRLYETALEINPWLAAVFILSSILALIAYVLALTRYWWGPPPGANPHSTLEHQKEEPILLQAAIIELTVLLLVAGLWPNVVQVLIGGRP
jgi:multicomponent Na+:H+ antiporter subunit D